MNALKRIMAKFFRRGEHGFGIVETLVAVAILGTAATAFIVWLSAGSLATGSQDTLAVSQGLARSQLEYTKSYAYNTAASTYPAIAAPSGYSISVSVSTVPSTDTNIQKITVTVSYNGNLVTTIADYKVNR
jgi:type II secretory pathway pseudopilin PulG